MPVSAKTANNPPMNKTKSCHCCNGSGTELDHIAVGADLRTLRESKGLTLDHVSSRMKLSSPYLCDLERGRRNWTEDKVARFKKACV